MRFNDIRSLSEAPVNPTAPAASPNANTSELTKAWITYLKNNQIVELASDPTTGKLSYKKKVTGDILAHFLESQTNYDRKTIDNAIQTVISQKAGVKKRTGGKVPGAVSQTPNAIKKREARASQRQPEQPQGPVTEDIVDRIGPELSERDVEAIFTLLLSQEPADVANQYTSPPPPTQEDPAVKQAEDIAKLQNLIKTGMTSAQRKELWAALKNDTITETNADRREATQIFKYAANAGKINMSDLHAAWKKAGFPSDLNKIGAILSKIGFSTRDVSNIFDEVVGPEENRGNENSEPSEAIAKIVDYINKNGIKDQVVAYMEKEFGAELNPPVEPAPAPEEHWVDRAKGFAKKMFTRKPTNEEVHQIFTKILLKERVDLSIRIKENEQRFLGRSRK